MFYFVLPEISAAMVSQVGAKSLEICPDQSCKSTSASWVLPGDKKRQTAAICCTPITRAQGFKDMD
jgi:hypothetical protein